MPIAYQRHEALTADGFRLSLFRHQRTRDLPALPQRPPVLLLPGMGANRFTFGLDPNESLPELLFRAGWDVWIGEFRGSRSASWLGRGAPPVLVVRKLDADLPAMLATIARHTNGAAVALLGHSLGGLLALLHAGGSAAAEISAVATICTPGAPVPESMGGSVRTLGRALSMGLGGLEVLRVSPLARVRGPLPHLVALRGHFRAGTSDAAMRRAYFEHAVEDIPGAELADLLRWQTSGRFEPVGGLAGTCLVASRLPAVTVPVLSVASVADGVVPYDRARMTFERLTGGQLRTWHAVGKAHGTSHDYAHADILLSPAARHDVLEPIVNWLNAVAGGGVGAGIQKLAMI